MYLQGCQREVPRAYNQQRGIEANPEKIQAILDMERPKERNEVSSLAGKIVALARFV